MIKWVEAETGKLSKTGTTATRFVVLTWAATLYPLAQDAGPAQWDSISLSLSSLYDGLQDEELTSKRSVRTSARDATRRAVRNVSLNPRNRSQSSH